MLCGLAILLAFLLGLLAHFGLILYYEMQGRKALGERYASATMRSSHIHDSPTSQGAPGKPVSKVSGLEIGTGTEPCHGRRIACLSVWVLDQLPKYSAIRCMCKVETLSQVIRWVDVTDDL